MERIENLVDKLKEQVAQKADPRQLLVTVQLLQQELVQLAGNQKTLGTSKVAVVVPGNNHVPAQYAKYAPQPVEEKPVEKAAPIPAPIPVVETVKLIEPEPEPEPETEPEELMEMTLFEREEVIPEIASAQKDNPVQHHPKTQQIDFFFDPMTEIPTLAQQQTEQKPVSVDTGSLNDKLKQNQSELQHRLQDTPIKDLRKAIGINDRFLFINDLFRGDEAMYERSIKTINNFNIYPEAEYWITRELTTKLGWNIDSEAVLHFLQLVKRRFS